MLSPFPFDPLLPVTQKFRELMALPDEFFDEHNNLILKTARDARIVTARAVKLFPGSRLKAGDLWGTAHIVMAWGLVMDYFSKQGWNLEESVKETLAEAWKGDDHQNYLKNLERQFPGPRALGKIFLFFLIREDPALKDLNLFFEVDFFPEKMVSQEFWDLIKSISQKSPPQEPENLPLLDFLQRPVQWAPFSIQDQIQYIWLHWRGLLEEGATKLLGALDLIEEENRIHWGGAGTHEGVGIDDGDENPHFSPDSSWMPRVVMMAKNALVWLDQMSRQRGREIRTLDAVPPEELDLLASRGINALWLIGIWERSKASREIKQRRGNPEAAASAYALEDYEIAENLGGWKALDALKSQAESRGIRLASDMVPNHVGIDSSWVYDHPEWLISTPESPFPSYSFTGDDLSHNPRAGIWMEDHYWDHRDAAVVFKRQERGTGEISYVYHGNDGSSTPWNDTAQIDFLNPGAREAVIQKILHVARHFSLIRFDAAMVLARKHIRRLWFPAPGSGGAIPSRSQEALSDDDFNAALPGEFWREVVDRVAAEAPDTLLLAEAFWMMEGYFVRTLGMHRVYNSAFMNMIKEEENAEYQEIIKKTLSYDPGILGRFVNFLNNPDEETAVVQFGRGDKYFAAATLQATLPGLPMIGHGQLEGLSEKYGMEYTRAYYEEELDAQLLDRHQREIFPLLRQRYLFAGHEHFRFFDLVQPPSSSFPSSVYAYTNRQGPQSALILVNNSPSPQGGRIHMAAPVHQEELVVEDIAKALIPEEVPEDWLLMGERLSGLWYLREIQQLKEQGLDLALEGYGRQLFLDFRLVSDSPQTPWKLLAARLEGRGTPRPEEALWKVLLLPVQEALSQILPPERFAYLAGQTALGKKIRPGVFPRNFDSHLKDLARACSQAAGRRESPLPTQGVEEEILQNLNGASAFFRFPGHWFRRRLGRLFFLREENPSRQAALLVCWSFFAPLLSLNPKEGSKDPGLQEWIQNHWQEEWESPQRAAKETAMLLARKNWFSLDSQNNKELASHFSSSVFRETSGVNTAQGVVWYHQENLARNLILLTLSAAAGAGARGKKARQTRRRLRRLTRRWAQGAKDSQCQVENLLNLLDNPKNKFRFF